MTFSLWHWPLPYDPDSIAVDRCVLTLCYTALRKFMDTLLTIIIFIIILTVLVLVHEAGHFFVARRAGIKVEEFGIGLPPKIWGKKYGETEYTINALPIGGFVRMHGETPDGVSIQSSEEGSQLEPDRTFMSKSKTARAAVLLAGVTANLLLAMVIFTIVFSVGLPKFAAEPVIGEVAEGSPAQDAGLEEGQIITGLNGTSYYEVEPSFSQAIIDQAGQEVTIAVENPDGSTEEVSLTPRQDPPAGQGAIGVRFEPGETFVLETERYPIHTAWLEGTKQSLEYAWLILTALGGMAGDFASTGQAPSDVAGPVGIASIVGDYKDLGVIPVMYIAAIFSINLAVINVLPFPALDGGRLVFVIAEAIMRRKPNPEFERWAHTIGMVVLLGLILLITVSDISKFF